MYRATNGNVAQDLAIDHGGLWGMSAFGGYYVGTAAELEKAGVPEYSKRDPIVDVPANLLHAKADLAATRSPRRRQALQDWITNLEKAQARLGAKQ